MVRRPFDPCLDPEKRAGLRAFADRLPAKHIDLTGAPVPRKYDDEATARQIDRSVWMTREEAATALHTDHQSIKPLIDRGALVGLQRGRRWYVSRKSVQEYKNRH